MIHDMLLNIPVGTHKYHLKAYENIFTGAAVVQFLLRDSAKNVDEAIALGNLLIRRYSTLFCFSFGE